MAVIFFSEQHGDAWWRSFNTVVDTYVGTSFSAANACVDSGNNNNRHKLNVRSANAILYSTYPGRVHHGKRTARPNLPCSHCCAVILFAL